MTPTGQVNSPDLDIRRTASLVFGADPSKGLAYEKAVAQIDSLPSVAEAENAEQHVSRFESIGISTEGGFTYERFARALAEMPGLDPGVLADLTPQVPGAPRACVLVARGLRGNRGVKEELKATVLDSDDPEVRYEAMVALHFVAGEEDLEFLRMVANTDSLVLTHTDAELERRRMMVGPSEDTPKTYYPIRMQACGLIKALEIGPP